jgi:uncharacterized protein
MMYHGVILRYAQALKNVTGWLDKAKQHAATKAFDVQILMNCRLAPDMGDFIYQVQSACDYMKGAAAFLSGQTPPRHEDIEQTIDDVDARIQKTVVFLESVQDGQYANAPEQVIHVSWSPPAKVIMGQDYLLQVSLPNVYFHLMAAYAILRHNGVDVGKMDFLGPIDWISAS